MDGNKNSWDKRAQPRVVWNFVVRYRKSGNTDIKHWMVSTIQNISKSGCGFFSGAAYHIGEILDITIQFPSLSEPMSFLGEVKRCDAKINTNYIGVSFIRMDEEKSANFDKTLQFFLDKQSGK